MNAESYIRNLGAYLDTECETAQVDFKSWFDPNSNQEWCELLKDIVAMANSGGGCIIIGRNDDGSANNSDSKPILELDPADVSNKVEKYTSCQYSDFRIIKRETNGNQIICLIFGGVCIPMMFTKPGTYAVSGPTQQKTAFSQGTVYFRHGAKSEPGTSDDLRVFIEREVARLRSDWLENVRKVIEAPAGAQVMVISPDANLTKASTGAYRLTANPEAPLVRELNPNDTHPHRQKEVARLVGEKLGKALTITPHDIFAVRLAYGIETRAEFCFKPMHASPHYSDLFVEWMIEEYRKNSNFFSDAKRQLRKDPIPNQKFTNDDTRLQWLDAFMSKHGINTTDMGKKLGFSPSTMSRVVRRVHDANLNKVLEQIEKLMEAERNVV